MRTISSSVVAIAVWAAISSSAAAQQLDQQPEATELAKKTQNPVGDVITVPFQFNFNTGGDLGDATFFNLNFQPVFPFTLTSDWSMILRTIIPIDSMPASGGVSYSGFGDTQIQMYITPAEPGKFIWGAGPMLSLPTATATRRSGPGRSAPASAPSA
jgi:hypothetical protein